MSTCCVCLKEFEGEDAPILLVHPSGTPLVLCPECTALVEAVAGTPDSPEREEALEALEALAEMDIKNRLVATELCRLIEGEDAPEEAENGEEAEASEEGAPSVPTRTASGLYFYLGCGCLAAALVLYIILRIVG